MTYEERNAISELHALQGQAQNLLGEMSRHMGAIASSAIEITQERWDELFQTHDNLRATMDHLGQKLDALAGAAGLPV